jgi:hypothetical protein
LEDSANKSLAGDSVNLKNFVQKFDDAVQQPLSKALQHLYALNPRFFSENEGEGLTIVFTGLENNEPVLSVRRFSPHVRPDGSIILSLAGQDCPGDCLAGGVVFHETGRHDAIDKFLEMNPNAWHTGVNSRHLIELEIAAVPESVGPPIDTLQLTKDGARWIDKDPRSACPDLK